MSMIPTESLEFILICVSDDGDIKPSLVFQPIPGEAGREYFERTRAKYESLRHPDAKFRYAVGCRPIGVEWKEFE